MTLDASGLEIFVLTYNRASLLRETLTSLCNQTARGFRIAVLDNGSTDDTPDIVKMFEPDGVELHRSEQNQGPLENFNRAKALASKKWTMVFHDDDLLHPRYVEVAIGLADKYPNVALIGSGMTFEENPSNNNWPNLSTKVIYCKNSSDFAALLYRGFPFHFGSTVYSTDALKSVSVKAETFGKIADRPFLLDVSKHGSCVILKGAYVRYRCHPGQDSAEGDSGPFADELIALHRNYHSFLGNNPFTASGRAFIANNYVYLCDEYNRIPEKRSMTRKQYIQKAIRESASTSFTVVCGWLVMNSLGRVYALLRRIKKMVRAGGSA